MNPLVGGHPAGRSSRGWARSEAAAASAGPVLFRYAPPATDEGDVR
jgi:hypothetical protein